jgi:hypothetical protein
MIARGILRSTDGGMYITDEGQCWFMFQEAVRLGVPAHTLMGHTEWERVPVREPLRSGYEEWRGIGWRAKRPAQKQEDSNVPQLDAEGRQLQIPHPLPPFLSCGEGCVCYSKSNPCLKARPASAAGCNTVTLSRLPSGLSIPMI